MEGKYTGQIRFKGPAGAVEIVLDPRLSEKVLDLCADALVKQAQETAGLMAGKILSGTNEKQLTSS